MEIVIGLLLAVVAGFAPMIGYALIIWWFDRYEKEPTALLVAAFLWGAIPAILFSIVSQLIFDIPISRLTSSSTSGLIGAGLIAPVTEEIFKGGVLLLLLCFFRKEIDSPLDGIIYGCLAGLGFAAVENVLYLAVEAVESGVTGVLVLAVLRAFIFGFNHPLFTGLTGWGIALARTSRHWGVKIGAPLAGLGLAMLAHATHNVGVSFSRLYWPCLLALVSDWGGVLVLLMVMVWATVREQRWIAAYLADEVEKGTLSREDYEVACSYVMREVERAGAFLRGQFGRWWRLGRYYRLATELAFSKHRLARFPAEGDTRERIAQLRGRVAALGREV